jgi:polyisoprenoid-binding protein YceI
MLRTLKHGCMILLASAIAQGSLAANYMIDKEGMHAAINFKIKHLGYSWLTGRFNDFEGSFSYDKKNVTASKINITIDVASIDSNHTLRDKHLRGDEFLDVAKFPTSSFVSKKIAANGEGKLTIVGDFTLHGVTRELTIDAHEIGEGKDPWGGYRHGFSGSTTIALKDYGINFNLGPASTHVELELHVEGVRQ